MKDPYNYSSIKDTNTKTKTTGLSKWELRSDGGLYYIRLQSSVFVLRQTSRVNQNLVDHLTVLVSSRPTAQRLGKSVSIDKEREREIR